MKKLYILLLSLAYLIASTGPVSAEATFQESKESEENAISAKEQIQAAVHFTKVLQPAKSARIKNRQAERAPLKLYAEVTSYISPVPIFLLHRHLRR